MQPTTPRKNNAAVHPRSRNLDPTSSYTRDAEVERNYLDFSQKYNLLLRVPGQEVLGRSPQKQRELASRGLEDLHVTLYRRFRIHHNRKTLDSILHAFDARATTLCKKWVRKPRGETNVTPKITGPPKATNSTERTELRQLLEEILQEYNPSSGGKHLRSGRELPAPIADESRSTPRPIKRTKSSDSAAAEQSFGPFGGNGNRDRSFYGVSTNVSRETLVFSQQGHCVSQGTQTTVEASSQEKVRWPPGPLHLTQDEYPMASSSLQALTESFNQIESNAQLDNVRRYLDSSSPTHTYSDFSSLIPEHELALLEDSFQQREDDQEMPPVIVELEERLTGSWPTTPPGLANAPLAVTWEVLRVLCYCSIDSGTFELEYNEAWNDQTRLWRILQGHELFKDKTLPEKSSAAAWKAALSNFHTERQAVVLAANLIVTTKSRGPFFQLQLQPLKLDLTHRLARRFGSDRFLEIIVPSIDPRNLPVLKDFSQEAVAFAKRWFYTNLHPLAGRLWKSFFVKSFRDGPIKRSARNEGFEPEPKQVMKDRIFLFAQDGNDFRAPGGVFHLPEKHEPADGHTKLSVSGMIRWLLQPSDNADEPTLKLFSRITLGLSRTEPTVVLEKHQLRNLRDDLRSPKDKVMNDGVGRMSPALARKIRNSLGLTETPAGFQGRIGSAKGFWILDVAERGDEIWIETYPSQRKWNCDFDDEDHRTFEVSSFPQLPTSASLNTQFLPILLHQASTNQMKEALRAHLRFLLVSLLNEVIEAQRIAMQDSLACSAWVDKNSSSRRLERLQDDQIPRLGGIPKYDEDRIQFLLAAGFHPLKQKILWDMVWKLGKEKCEELKKRINIKVGQSTYLYMIVDFEGILEEDEVHVSFSSSFKEELSGFSDTHLHGIDVLVARSPAHFVSDIQKVRAVFKPELGALKDVVVFPRKGNTPLADKLSGGDYDGDMAWVCWDPQIVNNFVSAPVPISPDLVKEGFIRKQTGKYRDLATKYGDKATLRFLEEGFEFNLQPNFLGMCTTFKESLCYHRNSVADSTAVRLSTMLSNLVDQGKQGIVFTSKDFSNFKRSLLGPKQAEPGQPRYKKDTWPGKAQTTHIIDYLKFSVMIPTVDAELDRLSKSNQGQKAQLWDEDLAAYWRAFNDMSERGNRKVKHGMTLLQNDIQNFHRKIDAMQANESISFDEKVLDAYEKFQLIEPRGFKGTLGEVITVGHRQQTEWSLLRASTYYKSFYHRGMFIWWIIGTELQALKALASQGGPIVPVDARTYASMRHDPKYIRARNARREGLQDPFREDRDLDDEWS